jgi:hypothetical protein
MMEPPRSDIFVQPRQRFLYLEYTTNEDMDRGQTSQIFFTKNRRTSDYPGVAFCLLQRLRHLDKLLRAGADPIVFGQVHPPYCSGRVHQKFGWAGDVVAVYALACVDQVVTANYFDLWIGKKRECVPGFLTEIARDFGRVYANRDRTNADLFEPG